jgi:hypothetical protein
MIKLILKLYRRLSAVSMRLCDHKWQLVRSTRMYDCSFDEEGFYYQTRKQCVCEKCGKWKTFKIK